MKELDNLQTKGKATVSQRKSKPKLLKFLPIIGLFLYAYIVWRTGVTHIANTFTRLNYVYLVPTPLFVIAIILLKGLKWKLILNEYGLEFSYKSACMTWCIGAFAGGLTPGQAGEVVKAFYVKQINPDKSLGECLSTVVLDKILEIISLMTLVVLSLVLLIPRLKENISYVPILVVACVVIIGLYAVTNYKIYGFTKKILSPLAKMIIPRRYKDDLRLNLEQFFQGIQKVKERKRTLTSLWLLAIFTWLVVFLHLYILALSLRLDISLFYMLITLPTISFVAILPFSISGLGTRDAAAIFFFKQIGVNMDAAVAWAILVLVMGWWVFSLLGWLLMLKPSVWLKVDTTPKESLKITT